MDGFFGIGLPELIMIMVIALIVLGPERLPGTIREVAKFIKQFRAVTSELMSQFGDEFKEFQDLDPRRILNEMTDPTKPDDKSKAAPAAKPATNTVSKPVTTTTTATAAAAAKSTVAAAAVANSNNASSNDSKVEAKTNGATDAKPVSETTAEANKSAETAPAPANTIAPPTVLATPVAPAETSTATNNSVTTSVADVQAVAVVEETETSQAESQHAEAAQDKPKRTRKAKSKVPLESAEQSVEQPEGEVPHESAN
ncbi:MAG: Sec-independent protein translocase protein TatB [Caldilineaceae bacterium]